MTKINAALDKKNISKLGNKCKNMLLLRLILIFCTLWVVNAIEQFDYLKPELVEEIEIESFVRDGNGQWEKDFSNNAKRFKGKKEIILFCNYINFVRTHWFKYWKTKCILRS